MATSMAALSRRLTRALLLSPTAPPHCSAFQFSTKTTGETSHLEDSEAFLPDDADSQSPYPSRSSDRPRAFQDQLLESGLDTGIYKAIVVGRVGQKPVQKKLRSGMTLTMLSVGTGGIRNNRRPLENETPRDYAERSSVQWHRVCVYPERLGAVVMKNAVPGSILYVDGNLETKIFTDPMTGIVRRIREISIRGNGRIVFLGKVSDTEEPTQAQLRGLVY